MTTPRRTILRVAAAPLLALAVLLSVPSQRAVGSAHSTGTANGGGTILFERPNHWYTIAANGTHLHMLMSSAARCTTGQCGICDAVWSPDGRRIAFVRERATNGRIHHYQVMNMSVYVMNANGSGERRLTSWGQEYITCWGESLAWSPDRTRLAIARAGSLYILDVKSGEVRRLTAPAGGAALDPAWSPDGSRIAFARAPGCGSVCPLLPYIVNADGRGLRQLSAFYGDLFFGGPQWSPDGRTIAFCASNKRDRWGIGIHALNKAIYAVNPDGSHLRLLATAPPTGTNQLQKVAGWSPDGSHILYFRVPWNPSKGPQATALWVMNANGTNRRVVYRAERADIEGATWSPDGQFVAFSVYVSPNVNGPHVASKSGLYVIGADRRHLHRLAAEGYDPAWQPNPRVTLAGSKGSSGIGGPSRGRDRARSIHLHHAVAPTVRRYLDGSK